MSQQDNRKQTRSVGFEVEIDAPIEAVWKALTDAAELERWFPLEARVEPGEGGKIWMSWKNEYAGESRIVRWEPNRHLAITWGGPDWAEHTQMTDYQLETRGGKTVVRVVTSGFPDDPSWDGWVEGTRRGWQFELQSLKHYLERHSGRLREVIYLRRRVALPHSEAWRRLMGPDGLGERPLSACTFIDDPPHQHAGVVPGLNDALLRISLDPCGGRADVLDVTLWLAAYDVEEERLSRWRLEWPQLLARLFPEGEAA